MANSPTTCQIYVALAIETVRLKHCQLYVIHYMDDIPLIGPTKAAVLDAFGDLQNQLSLANLQIAPEKVQNQFTYQYLGHQLLQNGAKALKITLWLDHLQTLNDFQKLLGDIDWIRPSLGFSTAQLWLLFNILNEGPDPLSSRRLMKGANVLH